MRCGNHVLARAAAAAGVRPVVARALARARVRLVPRVLILKQVVEDDLRVFST